MSMNPTETAPFCVIKLSELKTLKCRDKDELQDTIRQFRAREILYIALKWSVDAETWIQLETHE